MLKRKAYRLFESWLEAPSMKALLVMGARQVGKSYLVDAFCSDHFENVVKFDLIENAEIRDSFSAAKSADDLELRMSVAATSPLVPNKTAIIIDEVQECPNIVTYIKYLVQKGTYRFILTGSLLGVRLDSIDSLPVGYVTKVQMYPLDFEEFCWANGLNEAVYQQAVQCFEERRALPEFLYTRLLDLFHRYLMVGGMPDAVNAFLATNNIDSVRTVQQDLHGLYRLDITKYAPPELRLTIREIYDLIPSQALSKTRRFNFGSIQGVKRFTQVENQFLWLVQAGVALAVYNVVAPSAPLLAYEERNKFKLFYLDAGMLAAALPKSSYQGLLDGKATVNMGAAYEAFAAQELAAHGFSLRYFTSKRIGELDFLAEHQDGAIDALEIKSGGSYMTHSALDHALEVPEYSIDNAYVFAESNIFEKDGICYLPIFLLGALDPES